jgi:hypothetical protein
MRRLMIVTVGIAVTVFLMAGAASALVGSAESGKSADEIATDAVAALQSAKSVAMRGSVGSDDGRITLNVVSGHGQGGGVMFINGARFDLVFHAPDVYLKADKAAWIKLTGEDAAGAMFGGRWMKSSTSDENFGSLAKLLDLDQFTQSLSTPSGPITKGATTRYQGKPAIPLIEADDDPSTAYIAAKGTPYLLGVVSTTGDGEIVFSKYNTAKIPRPPSSAIDMTTQSS